MNELHIGLDDTDSKKGMCTTFVATKLIHELDLKDKLISYPELIRFNPTIPWKTRGNGALCIRIELSDQEVNEIKDKSIELLKKYRENSSNSGVVFFERDPREIDEIRSFSKRAVKEVVGIQRARELVSEFGEKREFGNGQGIVGALCACGYVFSDYSYELIAYREREKWGEERYVDKEKVKEVSSKYYPFIWDNFDWENDELVLSPNTPCPVLYGIRGDVVKKIRSASNLLETEKKLLEMLFKTNQGTDKHLQELKEIKNIEPFTSVIIEGEVSEEPFTIEGGHVIFSISDGEEEIDCAAYEPTKGFRDIVRDLIRGDRVKVYGGVRKKPLTINLEKIEVIDLVKDVRERNPVCPKCGNRMKSAGRDQGYRCRDCKTSAEEKEKNIKKRELDKKRYEVPPTARRHLSKPLVRDEKN